MSESTPYWITTDLPDFCTCGLCGALVWMNGEGVELHKKWHKK